MKPLHPIVRYHGSKWRLAPWILSHFPPHDTYIEPFGGSASVLLRKKRSRVEVYNDAFGRIVNLFRVLRDKDTAEQLAHLCTLTPYAEAEYLEAREQSPDPIEDARRVLILGAMGHGSRAASGGHNTGWRRGVRNNGRSSASQWATIAEDIFLTCERVQGVFLECSDALDVIARWDAPGVLFYVDPPYVPCTRVAGQRGYAKELDDSDHARLLEALRGARGNVVLSGYDSDLYAKALKGWNRFEKWTMADAQARRLEVLWLNFNPQNQLFDNYAGRREGSP